MRCAAAEGYLDMCQFLWDVGCDWDELVAAEACCSGNLELVQWLHDDGCHVSAGFANVHQAVALLTSLLGCLSMDMHSMKVAVCSALLRLVVRWAQQAGCEFGDAGEIAQHAARLGSLETLQYMQQQQIVWTAAELSELLNAAGAYEHLDTAKWLRQQGAEWPVELKHTFTPLHRTVLTHWKGKTLAWARSEGCTSVLPPGEDRVTRHVHPVHG
eukprot:15048-Heterococcus_DN1.PRE.2